MSNSTRKNVNRLLWTAQILVALLFLFAGSMKFILPADKMQQGAIILPITFIHFIGACEILGALGLVLPSLLRIKPFLTPLASEGLTIIMIGAVVVSILSMGIGAAVLPGIVGVLTIAIAYGRHRLVPIASTRSGVLRAA